jgi:histidine phosphotransfer protein HptB
MNQIVAVREYYSRLAGDPDLGELVEMFVQEMPNRIAALLSQLDSSDWDNLRRTTHQMKGAAGSYGFDELSPCAGRVEAAIRDGLGAEEIRARVAELTEMCAGLRAGLPG